MSKGKSRLFILANESRKANTVEVKYVSGVTTTYKNGHARYIPEISSNVKDAVLYEEQEASDIISHMAPSYPVFTLQPLTLI